MQVDVVFQIAVLIMSVVIHEVSHGYAALMLGDQTAKYQGRLTLNPLKHLDPFGSVLLPLILVLTNAGFVFGWAKPVPYNPYNLKPGRWSEAKVALAGPASNIVIALIFGAILRFGVASLTPAFAQIAAVIVLINILLAIFNLMPVPPLDGSKVLFALFPEWAHRMRGTLEQYGFILVLLFIFLAWRFVFPVVLWLFGFLIGDVAFQALF